MDANIQWKPGEIIVNQEVRNDPDTAYFLSQCPGIPVKYVNSGKTKAVVQASAILRTAPQGMLNKVLAGKSVVYITGAGQAVDNFTVPDNRLICPHFKRLKLASNGCFYNCDWCYLKLTFRGQRPFISVHVEYEEIKRSLQRTLAATQSPIFFNSGELADSLSMEHLTRAGQTFIPWFGQSRNGYLLMLTKSDNVDDILNLPHNGHTVIAWSMNNEMVSQKFEIGAPPFERRLEAAWKVQQAGYPLRLRLDPIVPFVGWQRAYAATIQNIFQKVSPERITLGTLRFEEGFYKMGNKKRKKEGVKMENTIFTTGAILPGMMTSMGPMFEPKIFESKKKPKINKNGKQRKQRPKIGKYSFSEQERIIIFDFVIAEIRKYSECHIALCKESKSVWNQLGLDLSKMRCVCQLDFADMTI
jgi:spore photoproduct lyase